MLKKVLNCALILCLILSLAVPAFAAPEADEYLATVEQGGELTFILSYDKEFPEVVLIDPDGNTQAVNERNTALELATYDGWAAVRVKSPKAGDWRIAVDKKSNTKVTWELVKTVENIWIQYIRVTPNADGTVQVTFLAERGTKKESYAYELALATKEGNGTVTVKTGRATTGTEETLKLDLRDYTSYEAYVLRLTATMEANGDSLYDEYSSEPFAFKNPNTPDALQDIDLYVDSVNRELKLDWDKYKQNRFDSYYLEVLAEGADEPVYYGEFSKDDDRFSIFVDTGLDELTVKFYGRKDKLLSAPLIRKVSLGDSSCLQILTETPTASNQVQIKMNLPDTVQMQVTVGENESTFTSSGKENIVAVGIQNGSNLVVAEAEVDGVTYRCEKRIYKDGFPPMLSFFEPYDDMTFQTAQVTLVGNAESAVKLFLNDKEIALDENGDFSVTITLVAGENVAEFIAEDAVGNRTNRTLYLYGPKDAASAAAGGGKKLDVMKFLPLLISLIVSIIAILTALILIGRRGKLKKFSFASVICMLVGLVIGSAVGLLMAILRKQELERIANSMELSQLADHDLAEAVAFLDELEAAPDHITLWILITAGTVLLLAAAIILAVWLKLRRKAKTDPPADEPPTKGPET